MTTIRRQLTQKLLLAFAVPVAIGGLGTYALIRDELVEQFDTTLHARAMAVATLAGRTGDGLTVDQSAGRKSNDADGDDDSTFFQVRRLDGTSLVKSTGLGQSDLEFVFGSVEEPKFWNQALPFGVAGRAVGFSFRPGRLNDERRASDPDDTVLVVAADRRELDQTVDAVAAMLGACGALLLAATFLVVPRVIRREFAPLDRLADQAARINAQSLTSRFPTAGLPAELESISARLNDLLARLQASFDRERRFSEALAHELRTPVAELRSLAELALKWPDARAAENDRDVLAIATQMEGIVTRLLSLLRSEDGRLSLSREPVALDLILREIWQPIDAAAVSKALDVIWRVPAGAVVSSDPVLLRSILANLLQNAVEYSPAGGRIEVGASARGRGFDVHVTNDVQNLAADDVPHLFERFWRRDEARSGTDHAGLGLPIARGFARALGCDLTATLDAGRLTLTLGQAGETPPV